ncbi:porin [Acinetobacter larvae]|uniref:DUF560 domain-containing protein n=1 Tax=Acinetobacter larvae TaxID=1789224 RepID=A0A1B2M1L6_9GAMM|nr:porin [Acinetobacter larvae]AOA59059.1 DUF560 domain-containing protein [Acinetobacter larvae]
MKKIIKQNILFWMTTLILTASASAKINLVEKDHVFKNDDAFNLSMRGSLRLQALNFDHYNHDNESQKFRRNGYSNNSKLYFDADYRLNEDISLQASSFNYINLPKMVEWTGHYSEKEPSTRTEYFYAAVNSKQYGTLKFGKLYSLSYDVVGVKTDLWDYSAGGQPLSWSPFNHHDGTFASRKTFRYEKKNKNIDFYAAYLLPDEARYKNILYKRKHGEELAVDVRLNQHLSWASAWRHSKVELERQDYVHELSQHAVSTAILYFDGQWMFGLGGGWYKNVLPNDKALQANAADTVRNFMKTQSHGIESYLGYQFKINQSGIDFIQPYIMGTQIKYTKGGDLDRRDYGAGVAFKLTNGIGFDYERIFTKDKEDTPNMHFLRLYYDF